MKWSRLQTFTIKEAYPVDKKEDPFEDESYFHPLSPVVVGNSTFQVVYDLTASTANGNWRLAASGLIDACQKKEERRRMERGKDVAGGVGGDLEKKLRVLIGAGQEVERKILLENLEGWFERQYGGGGKRQMSKHLELVLLDM